MQKIKHFVPLLQNLLLSFICLTFIPLQAVTSQPQWPAMPFVSNSQPELIGSPPEVPLGISASNGIYTDKVRVIWGEMMASQMVFFPIFFLSNQSLITPDPPYFQVYRNTTNTTSGATQLTGSHPASPYDDQSAMPGVTYYYWVRACNSFGCSGLSASDSGYRGVLTPPPTPPSQLSASDGAFSDKVQLNWTIVNGATYYRVFRNTNDTHDGEIVLADNHLANAYDDYSAVPQMTYYYWVKACHSSGCSDYSSEVRGLCYLENIANGDFEAGLDGSWTLNSSKGRELILHESLTTPISAHDGEWLAWFGGEDDETSRLSQAIRIPPSYHYLHFWYQIKSVDIRFNDEARIKVNGITLMVFDLCSLENTAGWTSMAVDLSAFVGTTITLLFEVTTDSSLASHFFLDDVLLSSSSSASVIGAH